MPPRREPDGWAVTGLGLLLVALLFLAVVIPGCGRPAAELYPVQGKVLYRGQPTPGALVVFHPERDDLQVPAKQPPRPRGYVEEDGTFRLTTHVQHDGAAAGNYRVTIAWRRQKDEDDDAGPSLLPVRYLDPQKSTLRVDITAGDNQLPPFELTR